MTSFDETSVDAQLADRLRQIAGGMLGTYRRGHTLQATALMNEAYLRLASGSTREWKSRTHFVSVAVRTMRFVLVDHARRRNAQKHGAGVPLRIESEVLPTPSNEGIDLLELDDALEALRRVSALGAQIVELTFFGGLTQAQTGEVLGMSERSVRREWEVARTWLRRELARGAN